MGGRRGGRHDPGEFYSSFGPYFTNQFRVGTNASDTMVGYAGNDTLLGGKGNDFIYGGFGNDELAGQDDNDQLFGEEGNDLLDGGLGRDELNGGPGTTGSTASKVSIRSGAMPATTFCTATARRTIRFRRPAGTC
jgi:Ca2+-binding RTX toxin-like protein